MSDFWDKEESVSEYEMLADEVYEAEALADQYAAEPLVIEAEEEELEEIQENSAFELTHEESSTVYNARLRLEQARLYEMIINHDLFDGVEVDRRAVSIVQNELKHYIIKRLEILMGLRKPQRTSSSGPKQFNPIEQDFLKQLAYKGTHGQSAQADQEEYEEEYQEPKKPAGIKPISKPLPIKNSGLKNLKKAQVKAAVQRQPEPQPRPQPKKQVPSTPKAPVRAKTKLRNTDAPVRSSEMGIKGGEIVLPNGQVKPKQLTEKEAEAIARAEIQKSKGRKPWAKMTQSEKIAEVRRVNDIHSKKKPESGVLPPMDSNQLEQHYQNLEYRRAMTWSPRPGAM